MNNFIVEMDELIGMQYEVQVIMDSRRRDYGNGILMSMRQIHVIEAIGNYPECKATQLLQKLGLLKGTFSKITKQLEQMGQIIRYKKPGNNRDVYYKLTEAGQDSYRCHYQYHEQMSAKSYAIFRKYSSGEQQLILQYLKEYSEYLKDYI